MSPLNRTKMNEAAPDKRAKNFNEVNLGYSKEQAIKEAKRCLNCKVPLCVKGCPVQINIPGFVKAIASDNMEEAINVLKDKNSLPAVCGRVCPQEEQCEKKCILQNKNAPIAIGHLERYAADWEKNTYPGSHVTTQFTQTTKRPAMVAVVGSGPAGLTCAGDLAKLGYKVTIFESLHAAGGVLRYGIPEFRLPNSILDYELANLKEMGIEIKTNTLIGRTKSISELFADGYSAVFVGVGAGLPKFMHIPGENFAGIYSANEFLVRVNLMNGYSFPDFDTPAPKGKNVCVVGGGNTAMDAARTALRLGANKVTLMYRRSEEEMPARVEEKHHAKDEGVEFFFLAAPIKYTADEKGHVKSIECIKMQLSEPDASGRKNAVEIPNSNFTIEADMVIVAIGLSPNPLLASLTKGLKTNDYGRLVIDDNFATSIMGVYAGGDIVGGETVIEAMGMGKKAAASIAAYLEKL